MHPYQKQINRMWDVIKLENRARQNGFWVEAICLSYAMLEFQLRMLLTSKGGKDAKPLPTAEIDKAHYLLSLADLAKKKGFIDDKLYIKIKAFNDKRRVIIHQLLTGDFDFDYDLLKEIAELPNIELIEEIQNKWLTITFS